MKGFRNSGQERFLDAFPEASVEDEQIFLTLRCKFNFRYFTVQPAGQDFEDWNKDQLVKLFQSLKEFGEFTLEHWTKQRTGKSGYRLVIYGGFPTNSDFEKPKHIPHQAQWARFRLTNAVRLVGFVLPVEYHKKAHSKTNEMFDCNTFYVVFLDANHRFYKSNKETK